MKACLWETGTSGRNLKSTVYRLVLCFVFTVFGGEGGCSREIWIPEILRQGSWML